MTRSIALSVLALALCVSCAGSAVSPDAPAPAVAPPPSEAAESAESAEAADAHRAPGLRARRGWPPSSRASRTALPRRSGARRPLPFVRADGGGPADHRAALEHAARLRSGHPTDEILRIIRDEELPLVVMLARGSLPMTRSSTRRRWRPPCSRTRTGAGGRGERRERDAGLLVRAPLAARGPHRLHPRGPRRHRAAGDHGRRLQLLEQESYAVADEVDFLLLHAYAMWNQQQLDDAVSWTEGIVASIEDAHPEMTIVLGETGWATSRTEGRGAVHPRARR